MSAVKLTFQIHTYIHMYIHRYVCILLSCYSTISRFLPSVYSFESQNTQVCLLVDSLHNVRRLNNRNARLMPLFANHTLVQLSALYTLHTLGHCPPTFYYPCFIPHPINALSCHTFLPNSICFQVLYLLCLL